MKCLHAPKRHTETQTDHCPSRGEFLDHHFSCSCSCRAPIGSHCPRHVVPGSRPDIGLQSSYMGRRLFSFMAGRRHARKPCSALRRPGWHQGLPQRWPRSAPSQRRPAPFQLPSSPLPAPVWSRLVRWSLLPAGGAAWRGQVNAETGTDRASGPRGVGPVCLCAVSW